MANEGSYTGQSRGIGCEIVAALMKGQRTVEDLQQMVGCSEMVVRYWLRDLRTSGLVRIAYYAERAPNRATGRRETGRRRVVYAWQTAPFAVADAANPAVPAVRVSAEVA